MLETSVRDSRISWDAMDPMGYSFLIGLGKSLTYPAMSAPLLAYVAFKVGSNFRGEVDVELTPHRGLKFRLRESHRLRQNVYKTLDVCKPECSRGCCGGVCDMVAVRKAVRTQERGFGYIHFKVLSNPGVTSS